jgi:hypothetical protein
MYINSCPRESTKKWCYCKSSASGIPGLSSTQDFILQK